MGNLVVGVLGMAGIGLAIGAIFYQATKKRPGFKRSDWPSNGSGGLGYDVNGVDGGHGGHGGDGGGGH